MNIHSRLFQSITAVGLLSIAFTAGCKDKPDAMAFERPPAPVIVDSAVSRDVPIYLDAVGKSVAREMVSIQPQVSGRITQIHFVDGDHIKKGALLFTVDPRPYQAQLNVAQATMSERQAALELAKTDFERVQGLIESKAISQADFDTRKNAVQVAQAQLNHSRAEVEMSKLNLAYCYIRSPIEGRAGQRLVDLGNIVSPAGQPLLTIQRLDPIYADFTITENELTAVQSNMQRGSLKVEVRLPDDPQNMREGSLTFLDNAVQDGSGTVKLRATVPNTDHRFWPGRFVRVRLVLDTKSGAVLISSAAPQSSAKGPFVYVIKADSTAELRPVTLGQTQGDLVVVATGLQAGEKVVIRGQLGVTPGGKVRMEEGAAVTATSAPGGQS